MFFSVPYLCRESLEIILDNFGLNKEINFRLSIFRYWINNIVNVFYLENRKIMI